MTGCDPFSPQVGDICPVASTPGSTPAAGSNTGYGSYGASGGAATTILSACGAVNVVAVDAGVTGNVVIADQFNNRVVELTRDGTIVWHFGDGTNTPGGTSIVGPNDAERLPDGGTLITGTGAPAGTEVGCGDAATAGAAGCVDNRVILVSGGADASIVWQFPPGDGTTVTGDDALNGPATARLLTTPDGGAHILIADTGNQRVIEVDYLTELIEWRFPPKTDASATQMLAGPNSAERLSNGDTLITDQAGNRILEVTPGGAIVWQYDLGLNTPAFASRLPAPPDAGADAAGNTLITDSNNQRIIEVDSSGSLLWSYPTTGTVPTRAVRLANGHTLIAMMSEDQVIEVDSKKNLVYSHGKRGLAGTSLTPSWLNQPYDVKVVGDYTGLTAP